MRGSSILGQPLMVKGILENGCDEEDDEDDLEVTMKLPKRAYLPTECIEGTLVIENGVDLKELLVEMERRVENYDDQGNYKQTDNIVGRTSRAGTNDLSVWEFRLNPELSLMPTWESREDGFNVSYCLRVSFSLFTHAKKGRIDGEIVVCFVVYRDNERREGNQGRGGHCDWDALQ